MAYNAANESRKNLVEITKNSRGEYIVAAQITNNNNGNQSLDIRQFYTNAEGSVLPTSKGVRISTEMAYDLIAGIIEVLEEDELMNLVDVINAKLNTDDGEDDLVLEEE